MAVRAVLLTLGLLPESNGSTLSESPMPHKDGNADRY